MGDTAARPALAYYISAHGYGHGVRSCDIIHALNLLDPALRVYLVTDLPASFLRNRLRSESNSIRAGSFDLGMVQLDSIRVDVPATLERIESIYSRSRELIEQEASFLKACKISAVVADIPALPLQAAARAQLPRIAVGNFGWDWIYSAFVPRDKRWERIVGEIREGYAQADLLLRLPFAGEMKAFRKIEDLPLVASPGTQRRAQVTAITGARPDRPWVLISFTSLEWNEAALGRVGKCTGYEFFTVPPLAWHGSNIHAIDRDRVPFSDIVASVDAVISKPGFGILSECIVNNKPLIYVERNDFLEYTILEVAIKRYLRHVHIPAAKLYRGDLGEALDKLRGLPEPPFSLTLGGASVAARKILSFL